MSRLLIQADLTWLGGTFSPGVTVAVNVSGRVESVGSAHLYHEEHVPVPFQLPPAPRCFVSRQHEPAALDGWPLLKS